MKKVKLWSDLAATWVTIIGALVGGLFVLLDYRDKATAERVKETLGYIEKYNKDPLQKARLNLENFWNPRADEMFAKLKAGEKELSAYLDSGIRTGKLEDETSLLLAFFENLRTCACATLCELATVRRFFQKEAFTLNGVLYPYVLAERQRHKDQSLGQGLELLAKNTKDERQFWKGYCEGS